MRLGQAPIQREQRAPLCKKLFIQLLAEIVVGALARLLFRNLQIAPKLSSYGFGKFVNRNIAPPIFRP